jgi:hypothetical protein
MNGKTGSDPRGGMKDGVSPAAVGEMPMWHNSPCIKTQEAPRCYDPHARPSKPPEPKILVSYRRAGTIKKRSAAGAGPYRILFVSQCGRGLTSYYFIFAACSSDTFYHPFSLFPFIAPD